MQQPEKVLAEIYRVLKPGGVVIFTFSNRMFYNKAIQAWRDASDYAHCQLVKQYFMSVQVRCCCCWEGNYLGLHSRYLHFSSLLSPMPPGLHIARGVEQGG
jgi:ubiquinone/menaquinone biosynthesis C-methylase UbiE